MAGPALVIAVGKKPGAPGSAPGGEGGSDDYDDNDAQAEGQEIVDKVRALEPDDLAKLFQGVSPEALQVMQKVDCLAPLADFIENGGGDDAQKEPSPADTGAPAAAVPAAPKPQTARASVADAMRQQIGRRY